MTTSIDMMALALEEARLAAREDEVPVGAIVIGQDGELLARQHNRVEQLNDPSAHAEVLAIREAAQKVGRARLWGCDLYVTLEPCAMCAQLISLSRLQHVIIGALDTKGGGVFQGSMVFDHPTCHHRPLVTQGPYAAESSQLLQVFFRAKRL